MGKIVIHIKQHTYPRDKDIEQLIAYISGHGKHHKQKVYYRNAYGVSTSYQKAPHLSLIHISHPLSGME